MTSPPKPERGLPSYWRGGRLVAAGALLALAAAVTFAIRDQGAADRLDRSFLTWRFSLREKLKPAAPDPDIILVELDEKSLSKWPEPLVGWGKYFGAALDRLHASGAKVVAFDWIQDQPMEQYFPGGDSAWADAIARSGNVVMAQALQPYQAGREPSSLRPTAQLLYSLPNLEQDLGYVELTTRADADTLVTSMKPVIADGERLEKSLGVRTLERFYDVESQAKAGRWSIPGKVSAPLRPDGSLLVNYAPGTGGPRAFQHVSLYDVATGPKTGDPRFRGKIVLVGASYTAVPDFQYIPVKDGLWSRERRIAGMEIHANMMRTLMGQSLSEPPPLLVWALSLLLALGGAMSFFGLPFARGFLAVVALGAVWVATSFALFLTADYALPIVLPLLGLAIAGGGLGVYRAVREEGERRQVLGLWGRYQDPRLVDYLLRHPDARGGEGREQQVTVLFADLKSFTKTVEHLPPAEALQVLNRYLGLMATVIIEHDGVVDKYLGDGLMAQWGAPEGGDEHATHAVHACAEIERRVRELTLATSAAREITFGLRLTLHTGPAVVGWVGGARLEFTIIGDTVNVTSRLQETAKELDCEFLISDSTYALVKEVVHTGKQAEVEIRGRLQPLRVYEVTGATSPAQAPA